MKRSTRTACLAFTLGTLALLARGQELTPRSAVLSAAQPAGQQPNLPELTLEQAVDLAVANNSTLRTASLETQRAADDLAANRTRRFANTQIVGLGAQLVTKPSVTFPAGSLGTFTATGPIPGTDQNIEIPRKPAGTLNVSVTQPLSTQYQLHLQLKALALGLEGTRQDQEKTRQEVVDQVRRAYYSVIETQSVLDSLQASLPYYEESHRLALANRGKETILESDLLNAGAQLLKTQNAISDAMDRVASVSEKLNDLMGRDIHTQFRVAAIDNADADLATPEAMEARALQERPDVKKAKLQVQASRLRCAGEEGRVYPRAQSGLQLLRDCEPRDCAQQHRDRWSVAEVGTVGLGAQASGVRGKASEGRASQGGSECYGTQRSSGSEKCVPPIGEHPTATGLERCNRTLGAGKAQGSSGAGEARGGIEQSFI